MTSNIETRSGSRESAGRAGVPSLRGRPRPVEAAIVWSLRGAALLTVATTVGILVALLVPALGFFREISVTDFLLGTRWAPRFSPSSFGVLPLVTATLWTTAIALVVAVPIGLGAAMLLSEYATPRVRKVLKPVLEVLAGVPTIVYGLFALTFVQYTVFKDWMGLQTGGASVLAAGLVMGIMIVPTIASLSEDAMAAVPNSLRQGSAALGANRMQTTLRVVFPAAISGIVAAIVLGISRAIGETMIVAIAAGAGPNFTLNPFKAAETMTGNIVRISGGDLSYASVDYNSLFAIGIMLFLITFILNLISQAVVRRFREVYE